MKTAAILFVLSLFTAMVTGQTTITVNGQKITIDGKNIPSGNTVTVNNGAVIVDGKVLSGTAVEGSGTSATEDRKPGHFNVLHLDLSAEVTVTRGTKSRCRIIADDNILPLILTEVSGKKLRISARENFSPARKVTIAIETPLLTGAVVNGSGDIDITEVMKEELDLVINGSGNITARGKVTNLRATINGSGDVHAAGLESEVSKISIDGSGNADVHVTDEPSAIVSPQPLRR